MDIQNSFKRSRITEQDIDEELKGTFPASDPPSWTLGHDPDRDPMKVMRIHAYGGPEKLQYETVPVPVLQEGQVLVRVRAASVNPIDCKLASGALRPVMHNKAVTLPWVPGGDFAGVVEAVGQGVKEFKMDDEVYGNCPGGGAYAQYVMAQSNAMALKPSQLTFLEAASVPIAAQTAWQLLFTYGHLHSGQTVLIQGGAGGVGSFAIQLARWEGARVIATASAKHIDYIKELGAHQAIDYKCHSFVHEVKNADVVLDLIGGETQELSFKVIKPGGHLISSVSEPSQELAKQYKVKAMMMSMKPSSRQLQELAELFDNGSLHTHVTKSYPLSRTPEAWQDILTHHTGGKIVLTV